MHVCVRENVWRGMLSFPYVLPHTHMLSVSSLTGCACVYEGECVEGHTCLSTCPPSCPYGVCVRENVWRGMLTFSQVLPQTHSQLIRPLDQVDWAISMCLPCLSDFSFCT